MTIPVTQTRRSIEVLSVKKGSILRDDTGIELQISLTKGFPQVTVR